MKVVSIDNKAALKNVEILFGQFPHILYELITNTSLNKKNKIDSNDTINGFVFETLLNEQADIAVLNASRLPFKLPDNLEITAIIHNLQVLENNTNNSHEDKLAIISLTDRNDLKEIFSKADIRTLYGKVTLVGFGPGSPDLLTIGGEKAISNADIIFYDDLLDKEFLKNYKAELVNVGKRKGKHSAEQTIINQMVLAEALKGRNVVRLKGGDPMIFAHGGEEVEFLKSNFVEVSVIPGVTTASAMASLTQVPLTHRGISSSVAFISGHAAQAALPNTDTVVCYMAGFNIQQIALKAIADGRNPDTPVMLVANVSLPGQMEFFYTLKSLSRETNPFPTPIICMIGDVVGLRQHSEKDLIKNAVTYFELEKV